MAKTATIAAKKSFTEGRVSIAIALRPHPMWGHDRARIDASTELTTAEARALAQSLVALADESDARAARTAAADERRRRWREREVAAGRMAVLDGLR
jgi:hypothetical protein